MAASAFLSMSVDAPILKQDFRKVLAQSMSITSPVLAEQLRALVKGKTRVDTGALSEDIESGYNSDIGPMFGVIAEVFTGTENQLEWWNRIYVAYQEGGILGKSTYTNPPRLMFYDTMEGDGLLATLTWGVANIIQTVEGINGMDGVILGGSHAGV